ncbi:MAG TPA: helix-turn-helix transcriptional regulator [Thermoanaerobaculia bacterium]
MLREKVLFQTQLAAFSRFEHPEGERHEDPREETAARFAISFLERGGYTIRRGSLAAEFTPESVFLQRPGLEYSCRHASAFPDDVSLSLEFSPDLIPASIDAASERLHLAPTNRLAYARLRLMAASARSLDPLAFESRALETVEAAAEAARPPRTRRVSGPQLSRHARGIDRARERMERRYDEAHSIVSLARESGMSPFHFARIFRDLVGTPPHRFLVARRLEAARQLLRQGLSVTETCLAVGFVSLSQFTSRFRRAYGVPPSRRP